MLISEDVLTGLGVKSATADEYLGRLNEVLPEHGIDTPLRIAYFLSQVVLESARFEAVEENLNYSAERLLQVFHSHFTSAQAQQYAHHPEMIGNRVYANRLGNGDEASGDGYRYRGRGLIQLTGKSNYNGLKGFLTSQGTADSDVVANPDWVASKYAVDSAVYYWSMRHINAIADTDDINAVTKAVNGSTRGVDARKALLDKAKALLAVDVPQLQAVTDFVNATELHVRSQPSTSGAIVATIANGAPVDRVAGSTPVTADGYDWVEVQAVSGIQIVSGYVADQFLDAAPTLDKVTHQVSVGIVLHMRSSPSTTASIVADLANGTDVEATSAAPVSADGHTWLEVKAVLMGVLSTGWVAEEFLKAV